MSPLIVEASNRRAASSRPSSSRRASVQTLELLTCLARPFAQKRVPEFRSGTSTIVCDTLQRYSDTALSLTAFGVSFSLFPNSPPLPGGNSHNLFRDL